MTNSFTTLCDSVISELTEGKQLTIGGPNKNVEIIEVLISHCKYNHGHYLALVWVLGGICRKTHQVFDFVVPNRTSEIKFQNQILSTLVLQLMRFISPKILN